MQIHEITCRKLDEGILGDIGRGVFQGATGMEIPQSQASINKDAASAAANLSKKSSVPSAEWKDKLAQSKKIQQSNSTFHNWHRAGQKPPVL